MSHSRERAGRGVIVVFAKAPGAGLVKTRMAPPLTLAQASDLYVNLLDDVLATTAALAAEQGLGAVLAVHPGAAVMDLAARAPVEFRVVAQRGRDLAQRMSWAAAEAMAGGARFVLLRGSDSPTLDGETVAAVVARLEHPHDARDVVVCPDQGGGYSLVGLRRFRPGLFDHPMSTQSVLTDTLARAKALGLTTDVVGASFDIDTAQDLALLGAARAAGAGSHCPRTLAWLDDNLVEDALWPKA